MTFVSASRVRSIVAAAAVLYPASLIALWLVLRYVGESWWATGIALYLPRIVFAAPILLAR